MMYSNVLKMLVPELKCRNDLLYVKFTTDLLNLGRPIFTQMFTFFV